MKSSLNPKATGKAFLRRIVLLLACAFCATPLHALPNDPSFAEDGARISFAILPDTQFYSRYATGTKPPYQSRYGSEPFATQTQWIVDHAAEYNIKMTLHLGDIVDQVDKNEQWQVADRALKTLEDAQQPYAILAGNHDVRSPYQGTPTYDEYITHFSAERAAKNATFQGRDATGVHEYHLLNVDGQEFLILALSWQEKSAPSIAWAKSVLEQHPSTPTVLISHQLIDIDSNGKALPTDFGEKIWNDLIKDHDQIFLTYSGHHHGATYWKRDNAHGLPVYQILMDYQMMYMGGNGYMGLTEFDLTHGKIHQTSFSPWVLKKPQNELVPEDQALLVGAGQSFSLDFDFKSRFPNLKTISVKPAATKALRDAFAHFQAPAPRVLQKPQNAEDYPKVANTLAHWRMAGTASANGEILPVGTTIRDIAGGHTLTRHRGTNAWKSEHVSYSTDHALYSSDAGSLCFTGAGRYTGPLGGRLNTANFFTTAADDPLNQETFSEGFTFETFIKIGREFNAHDHEWMAWLSRDGKRGALPGYDQSSEPDEPPFAWAFSNLAEVQFSATDAQNPPQEGSNWSGEIVSRDWIHLVAINDPASKSTTLYVDGVPVLRNVQNMLGLGSAGKAWVLGAGSYGGMREAGFVGCIGETRLVKGVLKPEQWLTARAKPVTPPSAGSVHLTCQQEAGQNAQHCGEHVAIGTAQNIGELLAVHAQNDLEILVTNAQGVALAEGINAKPVAGETYSITFAPVTSLTESAQEVAQGVSVLQMQGARIQLINRSLAKVSCQDSGNNILGCKATQPVDWETVGSLGFVSKAKKAAALTVRFNVTKCTPSSCLVKATSSGAGSASVPFPALMWFVLAILMALFALPCRSAKNT